MHGRSARHQVAEQRSEPGQPAVRVCVGKKGAARIILDLKDRLGLGGDEITTGPLSEVREALLSLGLSPEEARDAIASLPPDGERPVEGLLREALRSVGR